jgi:cell division protein FtsI/penicillin-binding protein 2
MLKSRQNTAVRILVAWSVIIVGLFLLHPFFWDAIYGSRKNPITKRLPKGSITDRYGNPIATGDPRAYPLGEAGEPLVWAYFEGRLSEQLTTSSSKAKLWYLPEDDEGFDVRTTLDSRLQRAASEVLKNCTGALIIMKLNGEILAEASRPGPGDPNRMTKARFDKIKQDGRHILLNRCETPYPPGSTFKILVAAKLLEKKIPDKPYVCKGSIKVGQKKIACAGHVAHGKVNLERAFLVSCNGAFISKALTELKDSDLASIYNEFSQRQVKGNFTDTEKAFFTIGQGQNLLTPIELATISATIASKGIKPKAVIQKKDVTLERVVDTKVAEQIAKLMIKTAEYGTAKGLRTKDYIVGAKTGTAQLETPQGITNNAVLTGFAGRKKPEIAFVLVVENTDGSAASVAVPRMKHLLDFLFTKVKH